MFFYSPQKSVTRKVNFHACLVHNKVLNANHKLMTRAFSFLHVTHSTMGREHKCCPVHAFFNRATVAYFEVTNPPPHQLTHLCALHFHLTFSALCFRSFTVNSVLAFCPKFIIVSYAFKCEEFCGNSRCHCQYPVIYVRY